MATATAPAALRDLTIICCPECETLLEPPTGSETVVQCGTCKQTVPSDLFEDIAIVSRSKPSAFPHRPASFKPTVAAKQGAVIQEKCPQCGAPEMVFHTAQLRSADEGQTVFLSCTKCGHKYSINS
ncbi:hypothetical protein CXG81DRAFT_10087 [Caulochytrium protostelioides]|uniref:DNA-directed RNA polymerase subunit n=1 Tax=Caulochytrium protostelioides TaxID=1555241 RepID=A0A4P9XC59_9FUNG|nr:hypothetical protein CXG81DRAFT_10087 [Caulochytrium protostelioides]|eukprot:RKP02992.1 hypothetical protein CXG81DRAFT_10087 [Caulochytrium protostelioides]